MEVFWVSTLYDLQTPMKRYEEELTRLTERFEALARPVGAFGAAPDAGAKRGGKEQSQVKEVRQKLEEERQAQIKHVAAVREKWASDARSWIADAAAAADAAAKVAEFVRRCVAPRALLSHEDAMYCAKFLEQLWRLDVPGVSPVAVLDVVLGEMPELVFVSTNAEASRLAVLLRCTLEWALAWRAAGATSRVEGLSLIHI